MAMRVTFIEHLLYAVWLMPQKAKCTDNSKDYFALWLPIGLNPEGVPEGDWGGAGKEEREVRILSCQLPGAWVAWWVKSLP